MDGGYSLLIVHHIPWAVVHCTLNGNDACIEVWVWGLPHCYTLRFDHCSKPSPESILAGFVKFVYIARARHEKLSSFQLM